MPLWFMCVTIGNLYAKKGSLWVLVDHLMSSPTVSIFLKKNSWFNLLVIFTLISLWNYSFVLNNLNLGIGKKIIRKPKPWKHPQPITRSQLMQLREEFWDTAPHYGGKKGTNNSLIISLENFN